MVPSPQAPRRSVDHVLEMQGGSPKMGLIERLKALNGDRKMSSPASLMVDDVAKFRKPSPLSSPDGSPSGTLERSPKSPRSPRPRSPFFAFRNKKDDVAKIRKPSPLSSPDGSPSGTLERPPKSPRSPRPRSPFFAFKNKKDPAKVKENGIENKRDRSKSPNPTPENDLVSALDTSNFILKVPEPPAKAKPQSGGFIVKGRVIPPPPSRPPPKLKFDKPLPDEPGE